MVMLHGGRLGWYLAARWRRYVPVYGGDPRYLNFVKEMSPGYWWKSFFRVMEPQAVIIVLIGMPAVVGILANRAPNGGIGPLAFAGLLVFMVGLYYETVADAQLQAFLALDQRPRYLNTGVWKHSRHPNYFGTTTVWWGMWLVAVAGNPALLVVGCRPDPQHHHADLGAGLGVPGQLHGRAAGVSGADGPHPPIPAASLVG